MTASEFGSASAARQASSTSEIVDRLSQFDGPPEQFILTLLAVQCQIAGAEAGAILRAAPQGAPQVLAVYPPPPDPRQMPAWLTDAVTWAAETMQAAASRVYPMHEAGDLYGAPAKRHAIAVPIRRSRQTPGVGVFVVEAAEGAVLEDHRHHLELSIPLLQLYEMRLTLQRREADFSRLRRGMEVLAAVNSHERFGPASIALCNEICTRWSCYRVSLGLPRGRYVRVKAMSETEKFDRKTEDLQRLEAAMEECYDQDLEILHPATEDATYIGRAAGELGVFQRQSAVLSLPLRRDEDVVGVLTAERPVDEPFAPEEIESLRLTCELCTARVIDLSETDRWFGARAASGVRKGAAALIGPKHTWLKLLAVAILAAALFLIFVQGDYTADGTFVVQPTRTRIVSAPFEGRLKEVRARPGAHVEAGEVLARLHTEELQAQLKQARARQQENEARAELARREGKSAEARIAELNARAAAASVQLFENRIEQAKIVAPIEGEILEGDWEKLENPPVERGKELFVIAPIERLRAEVLVPEDEIVEVEQGSRGELIATGQTGRKVPFTVEWIGPVAEVVGQQNVFRVRVRFDEVPDWLAPGMEGVAKIKVGRAGYGWIWTRGLVRWIRMKLWW